MKKYNFKYKNLFMGGPYSNGFHWLGLILIPIGGFALIAPNFIEGFALEQRALYLGIGALLLGFIMLTTYGGVIVSFKDRKVKEYYSYCGFKVGDWVPIHEPVSIELTSFSYKSSNIPNGISPTLSGRVTEYRTLLYTGDAVDPIHFRYNNKKLAIKDAKRLSANLKAQLTIRVDEDS